MSKLKISIKKYSEKRRKSLQIWLKPDQAWNSIALRISKAFAKAGRSQAVGSEHLVHEKNAKQSR